MVERSSEGIGPGETARRKVAVVQDYASMAQECAGWSRVHALAQLDFFADALPDEDTAAAALAEYDGLTGYLSWLAIPRQSDILLRADATLSTGRHSGHGSFGHAERSVRLTRKSCSFGRSTSAPLLHRRVRCMHPTAGRRSPS
jgi:hypothetical protein